MTTTTQELSPVEAVQAFFQCFGTGDRAGAAALFADTIDWNVPGSATVPWTGRRSAPADVERFLAVCADEVAQTTRFDIQKMIVDGEDVVVLGAFTHVIARTGKEFASDFALHVVVTAGRITTYHMYEDSSAAAEAFAA